MTTKLTKIALITAALMTQGTYLAATMTDAEELELVKGTVPYAKPAANVQVWPIAADSSPNGDALDSAKFGTATKTANSDAYWRVDGTDLYAMSFVGDVWRTFRAASLAASWNATTAITLTEITRDGATPGGGTEYTLNVTVTKAGTGSPADLTRAELITFLKANKIKALTTTTGTGATLTGTLKTGWTPTAVVKNDSATAVSATLGVVEQGLTLPITLNGASTATNLTAVVKSMDGWNLASNSTTTKKVKFVSTGGDELEVNFLPGPMARTADVGDAALAALNNVLSGRFLAVKTADEVVSLYNKGSDIVPLMKASNVTTDNAALDAKTKADVGVKLGKAAVVVGNFVTTADTNKYGLAAVGPATSGDITDVTWSVDGAKVIANGKIGSGTLKDYVCDLSGLLIIKDDTNNLLTFKSKDGDIFFVKAFDSTGLNMTAETDYGNGARDDLLALALANALTAVTTIDAKAADAY